MPTVTRRVDSTATHSLRGFVRQSRSGGKAQAASLGDPEQVSASKRVDRACWHIDFIGYLYLGF